MASILPHPPPNWASERFGSRKLRKFLVNVLLKRINNGCDTNWKAPKPSYWPANADYVNPKQRGHFKNPPTMTHSKWLYCLPGHCPLPFKKECSTETDGLCHKNATSVRTFSWRYFNGKLLINAAALDVYLL